MGSNFPKRRQVPGSGSPITVLSVLLAIVLGTLVVFGYAVIAGWTSSYWLIASIAMSGLSIYASLILLAMPSARLTVDSDSGLIRQRVAGREIVIRTVAEVRYRPLKADVLVIDPEGATATVSLFSDTSRSVFFGAIRNRQQGVSVDCVIRHADHCVLASVALALAIVLSALAIHGDLMAAPIATLCVAITASVISGSVAHFCSTTGTFRNGDVLVLRSRLRSNALEFDERSLRFEVRSSGEIWPRIECYVDLRDGARKRIPASGMNLASLATMFSYEDPEN